MARKLFLSVFILVAAACLAATSFAGKLRRDPLTPDETDQLREQAQEPVKRLRLYIKFAGARIMAIEQLRSDPKLAAGRGQKIHDLLEDFGNISDSKVLRCNVVAYMCGRGGFYEEYKCSGAIIDV